MDKHWYGKPRTVDIGIAAVDSANTTEVPVFVAPFNCKIKKVSVVPSAAITGVQTNNMILGFANRGIDGTTSSDIASVTFTTGTNVSALDEKDLGTITGGVLPLATVITFFKNEGGTGMNMPALLARIEYVRV